MFALCYSTATPYDGAAQRTGAVHPDESVAALVRRTGTRARTCQEAEPRWVKAKEA